MMSTKTQIILAYASNQFLLGYQLIKFRTQQTARIFTSVSLLRCQILIEFAGLGSALSRSTRISLDSHLISKVRAVLTLQDLSKVILHGKGQKSYHLRGQNRTKET